MNGARLRNVAEHLCGRRAEGGGRWPTPDHWQLGRWAATREEADADQVEWHTRPHAHPQDSMGDTRWPGSGEMPQTCSFCGGIHPDDAARLVREGWEIESTTKPYKKYLNPPGYLVAMNALIATRRQKSYNGPRAPTPPVKLYIQHFSSEQIVAFNDAIDSRAEEGT